ncbi:MAG: HAMP domain-containing histidine kinase [Bacteroidales bacterium]|jgi:signal transduction histidine kinase|nr:HAMP domain-containing histidine kinase [Bacteroidales bacterium]
MTLSYRKKLFLSFFLIFSLFTVGIILFEQSREQKHKTEVLEEKLDVYANITHNVLQRRGSWDSLREIFPENIRLTLIDLQGVVVYDNVVGQTTEMENHLHRPEIIFAQKRQQGSHIRTSSSNRQPYLYYAKQFGEYYVRVALPYNVDVRNFLKPDNLFLYYIMVLFVLTLFLVHYASGRFGKSIRKLKDFTDATENNIAMPTPDFPSDELGEIGKKIAENYRRLEESKKEITLEREKLLQHVHSSEEGICFFTANKAVEFYNGLFIRYLNTIIDEANSNPTVLLSDIHFEEIHAFLADRPLDENYYETKIDKQGRTFIVRINVFENNSFEIVLNDVTKAEKTRLLKQEMTGNITHELRTPVTGVRACLETILEHALDAEKEHYFIQKAYDQVLVLSELIQDMSLLTKIEDAPQSFLTENVNLSRLLDDLKKDLDIPLREKNIRMECDVSPTLTINGNKNLLYSIFRNLTDNVIRYAGSEVVVRIQKYNEDDDFYYFSYSDNGVGISEEHHLNRLFERFYRINEGRTRDTGGSGLGLSIVKNAVLLHKGDVIAKNKANGGLEFLFTLKK